jgi:hypothetical protein
VLLQQEGALVSAGGCISFSRGVCLLQQEGVLASAGGCVSFSRRVC